MYNNCKTVNIIVRFPSSTELPLTNAADFAKSLKYSINHSKQYSQPVTSLCELNLITSVC